MLGLSTGNLLSANRFGVVFAPLASAIRSRTIAAARRTPVGGVASRTVLTLCLALGWELPSNASAGIVSYRDDRLTLETEKAPSDEILREVARQAGATIRGRLASPQAVTARFADLPLSEALARVLRPASFVLVYRTGELRVIDLLDGAPPTIVEPAEETGAADAAPSLPALLATRPPRSIDSELANALGQDAATYPQLLDASLHQADPGVRAQALGTWIAGVESDPELHRALLSTIGAMPPAELAGLVSRTAGDRGLDLFEQVAAQARSPELGSAALAALTELARAAP
jgi:hypothetical protein